MYKLNKNYKKKNCSLIYTALPRPNSLHNPDYTIVHQRNRIVLMLLFIILNIYKK